MLPYYHNKDPGLPGKERGRKGGRMKEGERTEGRRRRENGEWRREKE